ncbi:MAG: YidB family protein [Bryobacteraceae bacterium]|nr:YidB family protein [Bryobacteraceae bacterium]
MNLFDLGSQLLGGGQGQSPLNEILRLIQNRPGGIAGLVSEFQRGGLGEVVNSWVSTGQNLPISPDQLQGVLGSDAVRGFASSLGVPADAAASQLTQLLPTVVDHLTPNGQLPAGNVMDLGASLLRGFLGGGR